MWFVGEYGTSSESALEVWFVGECSTSSESGDISVWAFGFCYLR